MAVRFCLNPTLRYVHIINPAVHGSCTDALFCHGCLVNVTYTATLASTRRKRRPTVASEPQTWSQLQSDCCHGWMLSLYLMTMTLLLNDSHPNAPSYWIDSQTPGNASHFAMQITLFSSLHLTTKRRSMSEPLYISTVLSSIIYNKKTR